MVFMMPGFPMDIDEYETLGQGFHGTHDEIDGELPLRIGHLTKHKRLLRPAPTTYTTPQSAGFEHIAGPYPRDGAKERPQLVTPPPLNETAYTSTPPTLRRHLSELPPTPPTLTNSEVTDPRVSDHNNRSPTPHFGNAVRNALRSSPGIQAPHTPDSSPPAPRPDLLGSALHRSRVDQPPLLQQYPSSQTESYQTAQESPSSPQLHLPLTPSPEPHLNGWTSSAKSARLLDVPNGIGFGGWPPTADSIQDRGQTSHPIVSQSAQLRSRAKSPIWHTQPGNDIETHISYLNPDISLEPYFTFEANAQRIGGLGHPQGNVPIHSDVSSVEDVNNLVYKQIQEENIKRNSAISYGRALPVGIISLQEKQAPKLKRVNKCQSLRGTASNESGSPRNSADDSPRLRHQRARLPVSSTQASPVVQSAITAGGISGPQVSSRDVGALSNLTHAEQSATKEASALSKETSGSPASRQHTLRHTVKDERLERTASLSAHGQDLNASPDASDIRTPLQKQERTLRHFSHDAQLENNRHVRRTSLEPTDSSPPDSHQNGDRAERKLRHFSPDTQSESNVAAHCASPEHTPSLPISPWLSSPGRRSLDARFLYPAQTPVSQSGYTDRSEVELCEAKPMNIYPHNNDSVLVVQHGSRPVSKDKTYAAPDNWLGITNEQLGIGQPLFAGRMVDPADVALAPAIHLDSPLTNPRSAPEPPAFIKVIPPTPCEELERELRAEDGYATPSRHEIPIRRPSLIQRARRYSESFAQPFLGRSGSLRRQQRRSAGDEQRPQNLSPLWKPRYFWEDLNSEDDFYDDDDEPHGALPRGGDTSDVVDRRQWLPRNMSVRMPGFRGKGGFLVGNSLGLDRHGTNNRQHYVVRQRASLEMLRRVASERGTFTIPFSRGVRVRYVGLQGLRDWMSEMRLAKAERDGERRRQMLRRQIQVAR